MRSWSRAPAVAVLLVLLTGCGVTLDDEPEPFDPATTAASPTPAVLPSPTGDGGAAPTHR